MNVNSNNFVDDEFKLLLSIQYYAYHELPSSSLRHHHFLEGTISRELGFVVWCMVSMDAVHACVMCPVLFSNNTVMNNKIIARATLY